MIIMIVVVFVLLVSCIHGNGGQWQTRGYQSKNVRQISKVLSGVDLLTLSAPVRVDWTVLAVAY